MTYEASVVIGGATRSAAAIRARSEGLAQALVGLGVRSSNAVALIARNGFTYIEVELALRSLDAYVVPLNWHLTAPEAGYILRDCGAKILIGDADLLTKLGGEIPSDVVVASTALSENQDCLLSYDLLTATVPAVKRKGSGLGSSMIYTSGTTGRPKGVQRIPKTLEEVAVRRRSLDVFYPSHRHARALVTGPQYHLFSQAVAMTYFGAGCPVVIMERFEPEEFLRLVAKHRITHTHLVPTMMVRLLRLPAETRAKYNVSSIEFLVHSGAPCAEDVKRKIIDWFGAVVNENYGTSETGAITMISAEEWLTRPTSVGRAVPPGEVRIYDEDGKRLGPREIGVIHLIMRGGPDFTYRGNDAARQRIGRDGLIATGDMGWLDEDGYLHVCDRINDMIISGGVNIYPAEIEAALLSHPAVIDAAVFGIPDEEFGENIAAHIKASAPIEDASLRGFLRERLAAYKLPKIIVFQDSLPILENGKILKRALREPYWAGHQRRV